MAQRSTQGLSAYLPVIVLGVLLLEAAFITSYVYGLHAPVNRGVPVDVVAPQQQVRQLSHGLGDAADTVELRSVPDVQEGRDDIRHSAAFGIYVPSRHKLFIASAAGPSATTVVTQVIGSVAGQRSGQLDTTDLAPLPADNSRGLVSYYLVIGWLVGAYLLAAILGLYRGMSPGSRQRGALRIGAIGMFAVLSGAIGELLVGPAFGYLSGNGWVVFAVGALLVFAVATFTTALESVAGLAGTGAAILLFVVLGNPSAGGPWPYIMQPGFYGTIGPYLPNGAATTAVMRAVHFGGHALLIPLIVLAGYAVVGIAGTLVLSGHRNKLVELTEPG